MGPKYESDHKPVTLRGLVIPADWDNTGRVVAVLIATGDENRYFVQQNEIAKQLLGLLRQEVVITGMVREVDGKRFLTDCSFITD